MFKLPHWLRGPDAAPSLLADDALSTLGDEHPCGHSLESDTDFATLQSKLRPRTEVQYGDFIQHTGGPDWSEVERDARALLRRSRDLQVLVWYTRARTQQAGATGLLEGLQWIAGLLHAWPDHVHPQLTLEGELDPAVRANTLTALVDPEGLLHDVRQLQVTTGSGTRLTVDDVERGLAKVRQADAPSPDAVRQQLFELQARKDETLRHLQACLAVLGELQALCRKQLGADASDLSALMQLLQPLAALQRSKGEVRPETKRSEAPADPSIGQETGQDLRQSARERELSALKAQEAETVAALAPRSLADQKAQVLHALQSTRLWIEDNEPSSPVAVLLRQAERLWGKRFSEVAQAIPPDLLAQWDRD